MTDSSDEQAWVIAAQAGSAEGYSRLVRLHQQALRAFLRRLNGNAAEADDLAQDSFVRAFELIGRFDAARPFRPWLFGIAWRKYREHKRGWLRLIKRQERYSQMQETATTPDPGLKLDLVNSLAALPAEQRAVLLMCLGQDFSHAEAAEALDLPLGTVKSHITRGRERLEELLGDWHG